MCVPNVTTTPVSAFDQTAKDKLRASEDRSSSVEFPREREIIDTNRLVSNLLAKEMIETASGEKGSAAQQTAPLSERAALGAEPSLSDIMRVVVDTRFALGRLETQVNIMNRRIENVSTQHAGAFGPFSLPRPPFRNCIK